MSASAPVHSDRLSPRSTPRLPSILRTGLARMGAELRTFFRERDSVVFIFAYPLIMMLIFGFVFSGDITGPGFSIPFAQYFLPGMLATGLMLTSFQTVAISITIERDEGALKRLRATPMTPVAYFLGKVGLVLVAAAVQAVALLAVAVAVFDVALPQSAGSWATFTWLFLLSAATGTVCGVAFSSVPRSAKSAAAVVTPVVLVLQFLSGVFFAFYELPGWIQQVASIFPLRWMAQGMRSVFLPEEAVVLEIGDSWQLPMIALVLTAWLVAGLVLTARTFRWRRRDDG